MRVITFMNCKGGVGKTTLCTNIARAIQLDDDPNLIMMVDADPQGSLRDWHDASEGYFDKFDLMGADRRQTLLGSIPIAEKAGASYVLIDTPGDMQELNGAALSMSDLVVVPIRPSPYDVWATVDTIDLILSAKQINKKLKAMFIINQAIPNATVNKDVFDALGKYKDDFLIARHAICHRVAFAKTANEGKTVFETKEKLAINDIDLVTTELLFHLFGDKPCP